MNDPLLIILWLSSTYLVVQFVWAVYRGYSKASNDLEAKLKARINEIIHRVEVVKENGVMYWFDEDDGEFLAQGRTNSELIDVLKERFPDHMFFLKANGEDCVLHKGNDWQPARYNPSTPPDVKL